MYRASDQIRHLCTDKRTYPFQPIDSIDSDTAIVTICPTGLHSKGTFRLVSHPQARKLSPKPPNAQPGEHHRLSG